MMPRKCSVCHHSERDEIDQALVDGNSLRDIAERFFLSVTALQRHSVKHLPVLLSQAAQAEEMTRAEDLLTQVRDLRTRTLVILARAEAAGDLRTALMAIAQARGNLELLARLMGELQVQQNTVNVLITDPNWLKLRSGILQALEPWPEARLAVAMAIREATNESSI
jgi:hypothetical protein